MARILVIEDNQDNLALMEYLLKAYGHEVQSTRDGQTGLDLARRADVDLIVCDVNLPKIDGFEIAEALRWDPEFRTPLIAVTALAMVGDRDKVLAAGFDDYISKPIEPTTFVGQIEVFLDRPGEDSKPAPAPVDSPLTTAPAPPPPEGARVLVVDDSPVNHQLTRALLQPFGYQLCFAADAAAALAWLANADVDLILSDLHMPEDDGLTLLAQVKADARWRPIPFVLISSSADGDADARRARELGASCFLLRPLEPEQVLAAIARCLARSAPAAERSGDAA